MLYSEGAIGDIEFYAFSYPQSAYLVIWNTYVWIPPASESYEKVSFLKLNLEHPA